jgi:beta-galactosidase
MPTHYRIQWAALLILNNCLIGTSPLAAEVLTLDASARPPAASETGFKMGTATAPGGHTLTIDSYSLVRDGKPWVTISGEFHYARCPEAEWRDELLKMKAGGINTVASYIFWIHHEEAGLAVQLRIGPWCHGEVRNGGFPNWLQKKGDDNAFELRRDNPGYLGYVEKLYGQIGQQVKGLMWKDGGPVIGIQVENEHSGPTQHLVTLKRMAVAAGIDVPMYYCTGWGSGGAATFGELVPMSGSYADGFWDRSIRPAAYGGAFRISGSRRVSAAQMGAMGGGGGDPAATAPEPVLTGVYPNFMCEIGGGMMASYHRRVFIYPADAESLGFAKLASGCNLLGFYMFHGGENPDGKLTYLNETQATNYWNDLPVKNYDFQAPLGAFGQERESYHFWRQMGLFLQDYGSGLANMTPRMPAGQGLNCSVRSDGASGYIFVSNYQRLSPQPARQNVQFQIKLAGGEIKVP